ncbi:MAG: hypothetical protein GX660_19035 [Clostridiaceae bacterium]|nr:hypothetical protein [Clostridiaceae bacterium]
MHTSLTLTALIPHGNVVSGLIQFSNLMRKEFSVQKQLYYPFLPLFYPVSILPSLPGSKREMTGILSPLKKQLQDSGMLFSLGEVQTDGSWIYVSVQHPFFNKEPEPVSIAQFPIFKTQKGIPLLFSKKQNPDPLPQLRTNTEHLRVCKLSVLSFSWDEESAYSFSWGETAHTWVKIES